MDSLNVVEVVSDFVSLKKKGTSYQGLCPFHNEKTPSFAVSPAKGIYKCFGCGKGGNALNFVMEHEKCTYVEAIRYLAKKYNIEVVEKQLTEEDKREQDERASTMLAIKFAEEYFEHQLHASYDEAKIALRYVKERHLSQQIIEKFRLGYCPSSEHSFTTQAIKEGYKEKYLLQAGLSLQGNHGLYDRFRDRIIFPIHDLSGRPIAFGGRTMKNETKIAKYINSPESDIYNKSQVLYGIFQAKHAITKHDKCLLVEGYTDVLALHQAGVEHAVASSGTALTEDQVRLIKRFTNNVTILYDGDSAGIKAALRGIDIILSQGMQVKVLLLPQGEDPDSFARNKSNQTITNYVDEHELDFLHFKAQVLSGEKEDDPIKRAQLIKDIVHSIAIIPDKIQRTLYIQACSRMVQIDENILYTEVAQLKRKKWTDERAMRNKKVQVKQIAKEEKPPNQLSPETNLAERELLRILIKYGSRVLNSEEGEEDGEVYMTVAEYVKDELEQDDMSFSNPLYNLILDELVANSVGDDEKLKLHLVHHENLEVAQLVANTLSSAYDNPQFIETKYKSKTIQTEEDLLHFLVSKHLFEMKLAEIKKRQLSLQVQIKENGNDLERVRPLLMEYNKLKQVEVLIQKELGGRILSR